MVLLATAAWLSGALALCPARSAENGPEAAQADGSQPPATDSTTSSLFARDPNFAGKSNYGLGRWELFVRTMLAVVFVVVLGAAAIYISRKLLPKIAARPSKEIRIVETVHLGPRKAVHLIEVANRRFLLGSTNENIRKLAEVTAGFPDLSEHDVDLGPEGL